jgi:hypothetical protein
MQKVASVSRRNLFRFLGPVIVGASLTAPARLGTTQSLPEGTQKRIALNKAADWFNDPNDGLTTKGIIISSQMEAIQKALEANDDLWVTIGRNLTKRQRPYQVCICCDDFFVFPLTDDQEALLGMKKQPWSTWASPASGRSRREITKFPLVANLQSLWIERGEGLIGSKEISVAVTSKMLKDVRSDYSLRLFFQTDSWGRLEVRNLPGSETPPDRVLNLRFGPVNQRNQKEKPFVGPLAMFVTLITDGPDNQSVLESNTLGTMVNVLAG